MSRLAIALATTLAAAGPVGASGPASSFEPTLDAQARHAAKIAQVGR